jgi:hypothetical protein
MMFFRKTFCKRSRKDKVEEVDEEVEEAVEEKKQKPSEPPTDTPTVEEPQKPPEPLTAEELEKQQVPATQRQRKEDVLIQAAFVEDQRVRYFCKATAIWFDALVVCVHSDDGPDRPYYTIRFWRTDVVNDEDGHESALLRMVEKQTTPDRLERVKLHHVGSF